MSDIALNLIGCLNSYSFKSHNEKDLQEGIAVVLGGSGFHYKREVALNDKDIIDFMIGTVGIEVKIDHSWAEVVRQLQRYALCDQVDELILVTTKMRHAVGMPESLNGKPLRILCLMSGVL